MLLFELKSIFQSFLFLDVYFLLIVPVIHGNFIPLMWKMRKGLNPRTNIIATMDTTDWKDALGKAFNMPVPDDRDNDTADGDKTMIEKGDALQQQGARRLSIVLERKGRGGKQATIITGFVADDEAVKQVASQLKRTLGVGGSARGGEILIQGDFRQRVAEELRKMGFAV